MLPAVPAGAGRRTGGLVVGSGFGDRAKRLVVWAALACGLAAIPALLAPADAAATGDDVTPPVVTVREAGAWQGRQVELQYRVRDDVSTTVSVVLTVYDPEGAPLTTTAATDVVTGAWQVLAWRAGAPGSCTWQASATDAAGNTGVSASAALDVGALGSIAVGRSVRGRSIGVTRFGSGAHRLLILGGVHGDEYGTPVARAFERYLLAHPRRLPAGTRVDVLACANPDGSAARTRGNARRVDLNRNLPTRNWRRHLRAQDASSLLGLGGGRSPGSEPETRALLKLLAAARFDVVVSLHSRAGLLDCSGPGARALGRRMSALCGLPLGRLWYDPYITGSLGRFVPERYGTPVVTVELRSRRMSSGLRDALLEAAR